MKRLKELTLILILLIPAVAASAAAASSSESFDALMKPYEAICLALLADSNEGVAEEAETIASKAKEIAADEATPEEVTTLLPEVAGGARDLAEAADLAAAREAFYELSKLMVRYRAQVEGERPVVVYCPMAAKSWLQPAAEEIGNPYYGQSMARCGEVVEG
jgi:hypothetical protein